MALDLETRLRTKEGDWRWFRVRARSIANPQGRAVRMAGTLTDVTDRRPSKPNSTGSAAEVEASTRRIEAQSTALVGAGRGARSRPPSRRTGESVEERISWRT